MAHSNVIIPRDKPKAQGAWSQGWLRKEVGDSQGNSACKRASCINLSFNLKCSLKGCSHHAHAKEEELGLAGCQLQIQWETLLLEIKMQRDSIGHLMSCNLQVQVHTYACRNQIYTIYRTHKTWKKIEDSWSGEAKGGKWLETKWGRGDTVRGRALS